MGDIKAGSKVLILRGKQKGRTATVCRPTAPFPLSSECAWEVDLDSWASFWDRRRIRFNESALEVVNTAVRT